MKKLLLALLLWPSLAFAQDVPNHAIPIGRGPGVIGFGSVTCASGQLIVGGGSTADPVCSGNTTISGSITATGITSTTTISSGTTITAGTSFIATTSTIGPLVVGGSAASSTLSLESTSGTGTTDFINFLTASQSERMRIFSSGGVSIGNTTDPAIAGVLSVTSAGVGTYKNLLVNGSGANGAGIQFNPTGTGGNSYSALATANGAGVGGGFFSVFDEVAAKFRFNVGATGFGYPAGQGMGGTVTQLTSKSTGVTLNAVSGQITTTNSSLAASTSVTFTLTNSSIAATDTIIVNHASGGTANSYQVSVDAVAAGSANITLRNTGGSPLNEAVVIGFTVIKGTTT